VPGPQWDLARVFGSGLAFAVTSAECALVPVGNRVRFDVRGRRGLSMVRVTSDPEHLLPRYTVSRSSSEYCHQAA